jgi:MFS family permease
MSRARLVASVLLPFAAGYYLSYLFRSINALIAGDLRAELGLGADDLGLLTSAYFLVFAIVVLPCGVLLDRYGPRLVDSALLLIAATGALVFALAGGVWTLMMGRALIGLGVALALIAGLKAIVLWFPPQRIALANGFYVMLGALGAVSATGPAEMIVQSVGWRGLFAILAAASAAVALLILLLVPEKKPDHVADPTPNVGFSTVFTDARFWRIAPLGSAGAGMSWALQGLWAAPWLTDVAGLDRSTIVEHLTLMAAALAASALLLGAVAERLRRAGISTEVFLAGTLCLSMAAQLGLLLGVPVSSFLLFACTAVAGATPVLSFAILARYFPKEIAGRANAALGVLNMGSAFGLQCLSGLIIAQWPVADGHYPAEAHEVAMATGLGLQLIALGVFLTPTRRPKEMPMSVAVARALGLDPSITAAMPARYAAALSAWRRDVLHTRRQATAWRFTAVASTALCAAFCASLLVALDRAPTLISTAWLASMPATVPTPSLLVLLAMLVMLTGCLVVSDRRFAARSLRARSRHDLTGSRPAARTAVAAAQRPVLPDMLPSAPPTVRVHRLSQQADVPRRNIPIAAPAPTLSRVARRLDPPAGTTTTGPAESVMLRRKAAAPDGTIRLRLSQPRRVTRLRRRTRLVANGCIWAAPPDGTDTLIVTRSQHGPDEPSAGAQPQPGEGGPGSAAARERTVPAPRAHPASMPSTESERRIRRRQADADQPDPIVRDNLGDPVPITAAEVDAIETYLGPMLRDLLADVAPPRKDKR